MGFIKQAKAGSMAATAARALSEGHRVFVVQIRGAMGHSPSLSRPVSDVAEQIEAIEATGWRLDQMTSFPYKNNITLVCVFRPAPPQAQPRQAPPNFNTAMGPSFSPR